MKKILFTLTFLTLLQISTTLASSKERDLFPDGTPISDWFLNSKIRQLSELGKTYTITDYGVVNDSTIIQTEKIQAIIDRASAEGGGVIVIPSGVYLSGSLFFKPATHLYLEAGARLKGSDDISNFRVIKTRIEGQTLNYFAALINADGVDGFTLSGQGTIDGSGERYWRSFWLRRAVIPKCTNMDELRPRLLYVSNSNDVQISGVRLVNSPFWTSHYYKCNNLQLLDLYIFSPSAPVPAPSTDAIDIDVCSNVLIKGCTLSVNDDAIALKGGKGPQADQDPNNGGNFNIIIENCTYGFCHSALTCGSESLHNRNIILRNCYVDGANRLLWLKMRPDTPQLYEYILVENITGNVKNFIFAKPWSQFFDLKGSTVKPHSKAANITMRNIDMSCDTFFNVDKSDDYTLQNFRFENLNIKAINGECNKALVDGFEWNNVNIELRK